MAGWRRAVELAMTAEEIETLTALAVQDRGGAPRGAGANAARLSPAAVVFRPWDKDLAYIIRRSSAASSGHWPWCWSALADSTATGQEADDHAGSEAWSVSRRAIRPRSTAIRTNCGRRGFWPVMRASADRGGGHECLAHLVQGTVCKIR